MRRTRARRPWLALLPALVLTSSAHAQPTPDAAPADASPAPVAEPPPVDPPTGIEPDPVEPPEDEKKDKKKDKQDKADKQDEQDEQDADPTAEPAKDKKEKSRYLPEISGYIQVRYQNPIDTNDDNAVRAHDFLIERVRLKVNGKILDDVGYSVEFDPSSTALDGNGILRDAYVWLTYVPFHELRIGQQKTQFGYENVVSASRLYVVNRAEVSQTLGRGVASRDIGLGLVGEIPICSCGFSVEDAITFVNGAGPNVQADDTDGKDVWGRIGARYENKRLDLDVRIGVSGAFGDQFDPGLDPVGTIDDYRFDFRRIGVDVEVDYTWAFVAAEYISGRDTDKDTGNELDTSGYYVLAAGKTPWAVKVGPIIRYDKLEDEERWTFGAYYGQRSAKLRAMFNYERRIDRDDRAILWGQARF